MSAVLPVAVLAAIVNPRLPGRRERFGDDRVDAGERRCLGPDRRGERVEIRCGALGLDDDAGAVVEHEAGEVVTLREPEDERPEADALHDPSDPDTAALHSPHCGEHRPRVAGRSPPYFPRCVCGSRRPTIKRMEVKA